MPLTFLQNSDDAQGVLGDIPAGSWLSTVSQNSASPALTEYLMSLNHTDFERFVRLEDGTKLRVFKAGLYNLQFSAQVYNSDGGGNSAAIEIWLKKNGVAIDNSGTKVSVTTNSPYKVAAWNFFVPMAVNDYVELAWMTNTVGINLISNTSMAGAPHIPSLIVTLNQVA